MNWSDGKVERKHVFYQKVDGKTFAVGYYLPRSSEAAATALLNAAAAAIEADPDATIPASTAWIPSSTAMTCMSLSWI
ncbi:hypothetical protein ULF88_06790 [Halopseudomonas pachastrellae]|nr:hypothetical protein [Halopseudomonas pachastrellae]